MKLPALSTKKRPDPTSSTRRPRSSKPPCVPDRPRRRATGAWASPTGPTEVAEVAEAPEVQEGPAAKD